MKKYVLILMISLVLFFVPFFSFGQNFQNPDFESGSYAPWFAWGGTLTISNDEHEGSYSVHSEGLIMWKDG